MKTTYINLLLAILVAIGVVSCSSESNNDFENALGYLTTGEWELISEISNGVEVETSYDSLIARTFIFEPCDTRREICRGERIIDYHFFGTEKSNEIGYNYSLNDDPLELTFNYDDGCISSCIATYPVQVLADSVMRLERNNYIMIFTKK